MNCRVSLLAANKNVIFAIVYRDTTPIIVKLDKDLAIIDHNELPWQPFDVTGLLATKDGNVICTGMTSTNDIKSFRIMKISTGLAVINVRQYDLCYTDEPPLLFEDGDNIICAGIKTNFIDDHITTNLIHFKQDLTIQLCTQYDTSESIILTSMVKNDTWGLVGVGYMNIDVDNKYESAMFISFNTDGLIYPYKTSNFDIWLDSSDEYTHINDAFLVEDGTLICAGYTTVDKQRCATLWKFENVYDAEPKRYVTTIGESSICDISENSAYNTVFSKINQNTRGTFTCIGTMCDYDDDCKTMFISELDSDFRYDKHLNTEKFCNNEAICGTLLSNNTMLTFGTRDSTTNEDGYHGIIRSIDICS